MAQKKETQKKNLKVPKAKQILKISDKKEVSKRQNPIVGGLMIPQKVVMQIADEVVKVVNEQLIRRISRDTPQEKGKQKIPYALFLDTSAIIDARVFDLIKIGLFNGTLIVLESVLSELKSIADSKEDVKKERGRRGLRNLESVKKMKLIPLIVLKDDERTMSVDDKIVTFAKEYKGKVITCDFNLSKKAEISGVTSIDMYELANVLKTSAVPGEEFWIKVIQKGKGEDQGVGYLPDGTMIVIEKGATLITKTVKVVISRIIQTDAGKIFFAKIIETQ